MNRLKFAGALVLYFVSSTFAMADTFWLVDASGLWSDTANWNGGAIPGSGQTVYIHYNPHLIPGSTGSFTTTFDINASLIRVFSGANLSIPPGIELNLGADGSVIQRDLNIGPGGSVVGAGSLTVNGDLNLTACHLYGDNGDGTGSLVTVEGRTNITGPGITQLRRNLIMNGGGSWNSGDIASATGSITNRGIFTISASGTAWLDGIIKNEGTMRKTGSGTIAIATPSGIAPNHSFTNQGIVEIQGGNFDIYGRAANHTGTFTGSASGRARFWEGLQQFTGAHGSGLAGLDILGSTRATFNASNDFTCPVTVSGISAYANVVGGASSFSALNCLSGSTVNILNGGRLTGPSYFVGSFLDVRNGGSVASPVYATETSYVYFRSLGSLESALDLTNSVLTMEEGASSTSNADVELHASPSLWLGSAPFHTGRLGLWGEGANIQGSAPIVVEGDLVLDGPCSMSHLGSLITVEGQSYIQNPGTKNIYGDFSFMGDTYWSDSSVRFNAGNVLNAGNFWILASAGNDLYDSHFTNVGDILKYTPGTTNFCRPIQIGPTFHNQGNVICTNGRLNIACPQVNYVPATRALYGGTYYVKDPGIIQFQGEPYISLNGSNILFDGPAGSILDNSSGDAFRAMNRNEGYFGLINGHDFAQTGVFTNTGTIEVGFPSNGGDHSTFNVNGNFMNEGGQLIVNGDFGAQNLYLDSGVLRGFGNVGPTVWSNSEISPSLTVSGTTYVGPLFFANDVHMVGNHSRVRITVAGAGEYDHSEMIINHDLLFQGETTLSVGLVPGTFIPSGTELEIIYAWNRYGVFQHNDNGDDWDITYPYSNTVNIRARHDIYAPVPIEGAVDLQEFTASYDSQPVTFEIREGGSVVQTDTVTLGADHSYQLLTVRHDNCDVSVKASHWLRKTATNQYVGESGLLGLNFELINGDCDGDNEITLADYSQVSLAFGSVPGDSNWNPSADLDGDGEVTLADYSILSRNFGLAGDD